MKLITGTIAALVVAGAAFAADKGVVKERLVECRGVSESGQPFHAVFRVTSEYAQWQNGAFFTVCDAAGCVKDDKLMFLEDRSNASEAIYQLSRDREVGTEKYPSSQTEFRTLTLYKQTGRFALSTFIKRPSDFSTSKIEGDCKKFVPSAVFE